MAVSLAVAMAAGTYGVSHSAGLMLYEIGTFEVFQAGAGWAARADDASTLFTNPAGLSRLEGSDLIVGGHLLYGDVSFQPDANATGSGNDGGNPIGAFPGGGVYYARQLNDAWSAGFGAFSYFGLSQSFDEGWIGRYYLQEATLIGFTLMPSVAYRIDEHFSIGAGFNAMFGVLQQEAAVRNLVQNTDGRLKVSDNAFGAGANAGVLYEASESTRFGVTYLSPVSLDFKDRPEFTGLGPVTEAALQRAGLLNAELGLGMKVPQSVMGSFRHDVSPAWTVSGNAGWQNWERFGRVEVAVTDTTDAVTVDANYKDTWHVALGAEWRAAAAWLVSAGIAYDSTPVDDADRTVSFAVGETWRFAAGAQRDLTDSTTLGFGYSLAWGGDVPIDQSRGPLAGRLSGVFTSSALHFFAVTLQWSR